MITRTNGNAWLTTTQPVAARVSAARWRAMTYASGVATATAISAAPSRGEQAVAAPRAAAAARRRPAGSCRGSGAAGSRWGADRPSSAGDLKAVESSQRKREGQEDEIGEEGGVLAGPRRRIRRCAGPHALVTSPQPAHAGRGRASTEITATITQPIAAAYPNCP